LTNLEDSEAACLLVIVHVDVYFFKYTNFSLFFRCSCSDCCIMQYEMNKFMLHSRRSVMMAVLC